MKNTGPQRANLDTLKPNPKNPRVIKDDKFQKLVQSIRAFPQMLEVRPIVCTPDGVVLGGNMRLRACKEAGLREVPVHVVSWLDSQQEEFIIKDNVGYGEWDWDILANEWDAAQLEDWGLDVWTPEEEPTQGLTDPDDVPEVPEEPKTQPGDLYLLGEHRLLCGDSTKAEDVERLMDGQKADMVFTDPPYNIGFSGTMSNTSKDGKLIPHIGMNAKHDAIHNDKKSFKEFQDFICAILSIIQLNCSGAYYISFGSGNFHELLTPVASAIGYKSIIIWVKNQSPMGGGAYRRRYEPIVYGNFSGAFYGKPYSEDDVWEFDRTNKNDLHPTMKPVNLVANAISHGSKHGGSVLDLFLGSGTTLIAAEKTGRKCYGMELEPKYCDVIVKRWEEFTGLKATKEAPNVLTTS